ncbi:uncharacterized protein LOC119433630 [Dermacentor silvarum]|uniref:uncharacterized protein LOC119433630 n=1 Tax=Dermacentor silvarum TaxID=543639 RepID=UPI0018987430|nr:uncharacterized protein LOC119433630 [Dermacentor silvarum]
MCAFECPSTPKNSFYGESHRRSPLVERVERASKKLREEPAKVNFRSSLLGPTVVWKLLPTQAQALTIARTLDDDVRVFSYELRESDVPGKRGYLVTHPLYLWDVLKMRRPSDRCMYEVIAEDAPCKLYFDLEFECKPNPGRDGVAMVEHFVDAVCREWEDLFGDRCSRDDVLWLDSSTPKKFSCHLIFQRMRMFRNNREAGAFVHLVCEKMKKGSVAPKSALAASRASRANPLVLNKSGKEVLFCDEAVYTRNRNFRLFQCTKLKKDTPLVVSQNDCYVRSLGKQPDDKDIFLDSLITWPPQQTGEHLLTFSVDCAAPKLQASVTKKQDSVTSFSSPGRSLAASAMPAQGENASGTSPTAPTAILAQPRDPGTVSGTDDTDVEDWLQVYERDVLALCRKVDEKMPEVEKVGHILKGIADDAFSLLVFKKSSTVQDIIAECRCFEEAQNRPLAELSKYPAPTCHRPPTDIEEDTAPTSPPAIPTVPFATPTSFPLVSASSLSVSFFLPRLLRKLTGAAPRGEPAMTTRPEIPLLALPGHPNLISVDVDAHHADALRRLRASHQDIFDLDDWPLVKLSVVKHRMLTGDAIPIHRRPYRVSPERQVIQP